MYLARVITVLMEATKAYFADDARGVEWKDVHIGVDYPADVQDYPGIWIDWEPRDHLTVASINHQEHDTEDLRALERWRFAGEVTFTVYAMTSLERARLHDQVIAMFAEARLKGQQSVFRNAIEANDLIGINMNLDQIASRAMITTTSTPWGTDDNIYEVTLALSLVGEYLTDPGGTADGLLSRVDVYPYLAGQNPFDEDDEGWM
jgi:hypothetical protein